MYLVYILRSLKTDKFYIGHALDLPKRFIQHNSGYSKSTKSGIPWEIVHTEEYQSRSDAMKREYKINEKQSIHLTLIKKMNNELRERPDVP